MWPCLFAKTVPDLNCVNVITVKNKKRHKYACCEECPATSAAWHSSQHNITQHDMLPVHPSGTTKLICDYFKCDFIKEDIAP